MEGSLIEVALMGERQIIELRDRIDIALTSIKFASDLPVICQ
jgi:hypothetical protein